MDFPPGKAVMRGGQGAAAGICLALVWNGAKNRQKSRKIAIGDAFCAQAPMELGAKHRLESRIQTFTPLCVRLGWGGLPLVVVGYALILLVVCMIAFVNILILYLFSYYIYIQWMHWTGAPSPCR